MTTKGNLTYSQLKTSLHSLSSNIDKPNSALMARHDRGSHWLLGSICLNHVTNATTVWHDRLQPGKSTNGPKEPIARVPRWRCLADVTLYQQIIGSNQLLGRLFVGLLRKLRGSMMLTSSISLLTTEPNMLMSQFHRISESRVSFMILNRLIAMSTVVRLRGSSSPWFA